MNVRELDIRLENAFVPMPLEMMEEIEYAFVRGKKAMKKRHEIWSALSIAAVILVVFAVAALTVNEFNAPKQDNVVLSAGENTRKNMTSTPYPTAETIEDLLSEQNEKSEEDARFYNSSDTYWEEDALYTLLDNAYWTHTQENGLEYDSRAVYIAVEELKLIPENFPGDMEQWFAPILETLQSVLGFSEDFVAEHYLRNAVVVYLRYMDEEVQKYFTSNPDQSLEEQLKHFGYSMDYEDPHTIYQILSLAYMEFVDANGLQADSNAVVYAAQHFSTELFFPDFERFNWPKLIRNHLTEQLGFTEEFIEEHFLIQDIISCMLGIRQAEEG